MPEWLVLLARIISLLLFLPYNGLALTNITLAGLFSTGGPGAAWDGSGILYAAQMALEHVNRNDSLLQGYHLKLDWRNSKCLPGVGMKGLFELLSEPPIKPILLGASCSVVSQPVAETAQHWNLVQMSFSSASDVLSVRERFKYFFRTCPAQSAMNRPRIRLMQEYGWKRVAVIIESNEYFASANDFFISDLENSDRELLTSESFSAGSSPKNQLENIKRKDARIIVASAYEEGIKMVFCEAYKLGMYGPRYVWMIESWNSDHWWRNTEGTNCTEDEMLAATEYYVGTVFHDVRPDDTITISGLTSEEYRHVFADFTNHSVITAEDFAPFGYDAVWAVALALHQVDMDLKRNSSLPGIMDFDYENTFELRQRIFEKLSTLQFEGITGPVSFDARGNRLGISKFEQLIPSRDKEEDVAIYYPSGELIWNYNATRFQFKGGTIPRDGPLLLSQEIGIPDGVFYVFTTLAILGMILTVGFVAFNLVHRRKRLIKLSCPAMNNVIGVGCFVCHLSVIPAGINGAKYKELTGLCMIKTWILCIGFTLAFGGLLLKTWRVHLIFQNKTKRIRIFNSHLFIILGIFIALDIVILISWTVIDPQIRQGVNLPDLVNKHDDTITIRTVYKCQTTLNKYVWVVIIFVWKGLQLLYGATLAWETRKVTVPELNDSKFIGVAIYNIAIPTAIVGPLANFLDGMPALAYSLSSGCIIFCTVTTSCLVFLPKVIGVLSADPNDDNLRISTIANESISQQPSRVVPLDNGPSGPPDTHVQKVKDQRNGVKVSAVHRLLEEKEEQISHLKKINEQLRKIIQDQATKP